MIGRYPVILAVACAALLAGCGSKSGSAGRPSATAMPIAMPPSGAYSATSNIVADATSFARWTLGSFTKHGNGPGGSADLEMLGTGEPQGSSDAYSPIVTVGSGKSYIFSLWIDPSHITGGFGVLGIYAPSRAITYGQVRINPGPPGRYSVDGVVPADQHQIRIDFQPNGLSIENGKTLRIAQPMLKIGKLPNVKPKALHLVLPPVGAGPHRTSAPGVRATHAAPLPSPART